MKFNFWITPYLSKLRYSHNSVSLRILHFLPWLVWLSGLSTSLQTKGWLVRFPVRAYAWVVSQVPSRWHTWGNHTLMFPSHSSFLPLCLKIKKINLQKIYIAFFLENFYPLHSKYKYISFLKFKKNLLYLEDIYRRIYKTEKFWKWWYLLARQR